MTTNRNDLHKYFCSIVSTIINALYNANLPIIFKGMVVTRIILKNNNAEFIRETEDIDGDWVGDKLSLIDIEKAINSALNGLENIQVKAFRDYDEHTSAGFDILQNNIKIGSFDLSIRNNEFYKLYDIDGIRFYGQTIEKTIADKVCVLSSRKIFRRPKDLLDLYCLSKINNIDPITIKDIINKSNRVLDNFHPLLTQRKEIEHAYESMYWLENNPPFKDVYECCVEIANKLIKEL